MADRWGWEETATDWRAVIDRKDIDAVDICLPNHMHGPVAIAAAQAGKTILCEKPLALSLREARTMAEAARGLATLVWFNYRRVPAIAFARQLIEDGRLGRVFHYNASYKQQWGAYTSRPPSWKMDPSLAGSGVGGGRNSSTAPIITAAGIGSPTGPSSTPFSRASVSMACNQCS